MRIVVAEDSVLFREGLVRLLTELGHAVAAAVSDSVSLHDAIRGRAPALVVVDIRMPPRPSDLQPDPAAGAQAALTIRAANPSVGILLLSQHIQLRHCAQLLGSPGFGYLLKDRVLHLEEFDATLRRIAAGGTAVDPAVVQALVHADRPSLSRLTEREREVLALTAGGLSNSSVAHELGVSGRTVETHLRSIFGKLNLADDGHGHRRVQAVLAYLRPADGADMTR